MATATKKVKIELTDSELALIRQLCLPDKIISANLGITHMGIRNRVVRIGAKLGVENRTAIVIKALRLKLVKIDQFSPREFPWRN